MAIPKILHFVWTGDKPVRGVWKDFYRRWERTHPHWEIRLWDEDRMRAYTAEHHPELMELFEFWRTHDSLNNVFRYIALRRFGGVYADLDVIPLRKLDLITDATDFFCCVEPKEHTGNRPEFGLPYLVSSAFLGSVAGHPFWTRLLDQIITTKETFRYLASGVYAVNQAVLNAPREVRPQMVLPPFWSPVLKHNVPIGPDPEMEGLVRREFDVVPLSGEAIVSHLWLGSWIGMPTSFPGLATLTRWWVRMGSVKWDWRLARNPELARLEFKPPALVYDRQLPVEVAALPPVTVAMRLQGFGDAAAAKRLVASLDYPKHLLSVLAVGEGAAEWFEGEAGSGKAIADRNRMADIAAGRGGLTLFVEPGLDVPRDVIQRLLGAGHPVVAGLVEGRGPEHSQNWRYQPYATFRTFYRLGARDGTALPDQPSLKRWLDNLLGWGIAPLTGVDPALLLVDNRVLAAGVRFAEAPYKRHLDGVGFGLMARDNGFEVCGVPGVVARTGREN